MKDMKDMKDLWMMPTSTGISEVPAPTPPTKYQYYMMVGPCPGDTAQDPACICWHNEGEGPYPDMKHDQISAHELPRPQTQARHQPRHHHAAHRRRVDCHVDWNETMSITHNLHRLFIRYGRYIFITICEFAFVALMIWGSYSAGHWVARYWPIQ